MEEILVHVGGDIRRRTPTGTAVFHAVAVFLRVLALHVDRHTEDHRTGDPHKEVNRVKTQPQGGKRCRETVPDGEYLCGEVRAGCQPDRLGQLIEGIHEQEVGEV